MKQNSSKTLLIYLNVDSLPKLKGDIESIVAHDNEEAKRYVLNAKGFSHVIVLRLVDSIDGIYVRLPFGQKMDLMNMLDYLEESGFEIGAYSFEQDSSFYRSVYTDFYGHKKQKKKIYEIVAPSIDSLDACYRFLKKHFGEEQ